MEIKKPVCSYGVACFRKNPVHLKQLSHPHLDKLLANISGSDVILPDNLDFKCGNRTLLREQLEILRTVKQNESSSESSQGTSDEPGARALWEKSDPKRSDRNASRDRKDEGRGRESRKNFNHKENKSNGGETSRVSGDERSRKMREVVLKKMAEAGVSPAYVAPMGDFALKWFLAAPYHVFFTTVPKTPATWGQSLSVTLSEILDRSLGDIVQSLHLNMVVDFGWLCSQYLLAGQDHKAGMSVFYHMRSDEGELPESIEAHRVKCPSTFGTHHAKISIFRYKDDGIRIVVSTANLYLDDWEYRTQGLWMSPHLPRLNVVAKPTDGDSPTGFKKDLMSFLENYDRSMNNWRAIVSRADCSAINVAFVGSIPGEFPLNDEHWGHQKLGSLLRDHVTIPDNETRTRIVAQASSIGSLGPNYHSWIGNEIVASMSKNKEMKNKLIDFKFIFPTIENYRQSHDMGEISNCLCNPNQKKQNWIIEYMHKWKADRLERTRAIPHIKTFARISTDDKRAWWLVLGSANLSKAAWGYRYRGKYRISSYEAGVLFLPKFVTGESDFSISDDTTKSTPTFPISYDLPLTPYSSTDKPFVDDFFRDDYKG